MCMHERSLTLTVLRTYMLNKTCWKKLAHLLISNPNTISFDPAVGPDPVRVGTLVLPCLEVEARGRKMYTQNKLQLDNQNYFILIRI